MNQSLNIAHHVGEDLLLAYAAGSLAEGWSLAVATHDCGRVTHCAEWPMQWRPTCRGLREQPAMSRPLNPHVQVNCSSLTALGAESGHACSSARLS